jgi:hypothetical protein
MNLFLINELRIELVKTKLIWNLKKGLDDKGIIKEACAPVNFYLKKYHAKLGISI